VPEQIEVSNADQVSKSLLGVINRGATTLIVDMTATRSCDHAGANALMSATSGPTAPPCCWWFPVRACGRC
jgi:anti-anti-sigma regulatory factor